MDNQLINCISELQGLEPSDATRTRLLEQDEIFLHAKIRLLADELPFETTPDDFMDTLAAMACP